MVGNGTIALHNVYRKVNAVHNVYRIFFSGLKWGLIGGFLLLRNFSVAISVNPHFCFILVLILISMFLR